MAPRKTVPVHPALAVADARQAAKDAAAAKADRSPHLLTADDLEFLHGRRILELGNAGLSRHLGIGQPVKLTPPAKTPKTAASRGRGPLSDDDLKKLTGQQISRAMAAGLVPGVGAKRKRR